MSIEFPFVCRCVCVCMWRARVLLLGALPASSNSSSSTSPRQQQSHERTNNAISSGVANWFQYQIAIPFSVPIFLFFLAVVLRVIRAGYFPCYQQNNIWVDLFQSLSFASLLGFVLGILWFVCFFFIPLCASLRDRHKSRRHTHNTPIIDMMDMFGSLCLSLSSSYYCNMRDANDTRNCSARGSTFYSWLIWVRKHVTISNYTTMMMTDTQCVSVCGGPQLTQLRVMSSESKSWPRLAWESSGSLCAVSVTRLTHIHHLYLLL